MTAQTITAPATRAVCADCGRPVIECPHSHGPYGKAWDHVSKLGTGPCAGLLSAFAVRDVPLVSLVRSNPADCEPCLICGEPFPPAGDSPLCPDCRANAGPAV